MVILSFLTKNIKVEYLNGAFYHYDKNINQNSLTKKIKINDLNLYIKEIEKIFENFPNKTHYIKIAKVVAKKTVFYKRLNKTKDEYNSFLPEIKKNDLIKYSFSVKEKISFLLPYSIYYKLKIKK